MEPTGPIESAISWLLLKAYQRRLRALVATASRAHDACGS